MLYAIAHYILWVMRPVPFKDVWTWGGLCICSGVFGSLYHSLLFSVFFEGGVAWWLAVAASYLTTVTFVMMLGFLRVSAIVVCAGAMCVAVVIWPTFAAGLSDIMQTVSLFVGTFISLPLFGREMERIRPELDKHR